MTGMNGEEGGFFRCRIRMDLARFEEEGFFI